jgi:hypothetical protein
MTSLQPSYYLRNFQIEPSTELHSSFGMRGRGQLPFSEDAGFIRYECRY